MGILSLGPSHGIMILNGLVKYDNQIGKKKYEFVEMNGKIANGDQKAFDDSVKQLRGAKKFLGCITLCCCCCPCSNCFTTTKKSKAKKLD
jgi:hypothetical protein